MTIDPVRGWRSWSLGRAALCSPSMGQTWPVSQPMSGEHIATVGTKTQCEGDSCRCGINAMDDPAQLVREGYVKPGFVLGEVNLWGRVREHESGWKAETGYPACLWATRQRDQQRVADMAAHYGCEYGGWVDLGRWHSIIGRMMWGGVRGASERAMVILAIAWILSIIFAVVSAFSESEIAGRFAATFHTLIYMWISWMLLRIVWGRFVCRAMRSRAVPMTFHPAPGQVAP